MGPLGGATKSGAHSTCKDGTSTLRSETIEITKNAQGGNPVAQSDRRL
jgi:hypothetical protein